MRNRIWAELTQAKHNIEFTTLYSDQQRTVLRIFNIGVLAFSSAGIMGWQVWHNLPLIACSIIALISLLRLLQPYLIMDEKQLKNLDDIHRFYADYFNKLEMLWFDFESDRITEEQATERFFKLKKSETDINSIIAETVRSASKRILNKCKLISDDYFKRVFNT